ncbi:DUF922 domain-containing protein [Aestuariivita boseongensis]|uniref:DUF922 domain-containing protein n=1 Tax=Aestuariivita boseongensis TaxID=1470562 RepID=UPI0006824DED|nr:DUF922 domain-containing protein [Aestuariivita boseongensis]
MIRTLVILAFLAAASPVDAAPKETETIQYYSISGETLADLRRDMARHGPQGFWGYTKWWITWSRNCDIDLEITITLPRLARTARLSECDLRVWNAMTEALYRHEQMHAEHGRRAAAAIHASDCSAPRRVIQIWAERDRALDRETRHGATQGVTLLD